MQETTKPAAMKRQRREMRGPEVQQLSIVGPSGWSERFRRGGRADRRLSGLGGKDWNPHALYEESNLICRWDTAKAVKNSIERLAFRQASRRRKAKFLPEPNPLGKIWLRRLPRWIN